MNESKMEKYTNMFYLNVHLRFWCIPYNQKKLFSGVSWGYQIFRLYLELEFRIFAEEKRSVITVV